MTKTINFIIKKGKHYAGNFFRMRITFSSSISISYSLSRTAVYDYSKVINGWSKIIGLTDLMVHRNSCRLVFINTSKGLFAGCSIYQAGVRSIKTITDIQPETEYHVLIERSRRHYIITHTRSDKTQSTSRFFVSRRKLPFQFILHPYVGGRFTLDNDITIKITRHNVP